MLRNILLTRHDKVWYNKDMIIINKECTKCKITKNIELFPKESRVKSGYNAKCKSCCGVYNKLIRVKNNYLSKEREYYKNNKNRVDEAKKKYKKNNIEKCKESSLMHYRKNIFKYKLQSTKLRCIKLKREFLISDEHYLMLCSSPCYYCNYVGYNGVDRIDSNVGYTIENTVPCCSQCNTMKLDYTVDEFLTKCRQIIKKWDK